MSKKFEFIQGVINQDMYNDARFKSLVTELKSFLAERAKFASDDYVVTTFVTDKLVINMQVKIDKFL